MSFYPIFLRLDIFDISATQYIWDPIFLRPDISETQYFWDPVFLRPDISETWYLWHPIFLRSNISETQYFCDLIFLWLDISVTQYFCEPIFLRPDISDYFRLFQSISEVLCLFKWIFLDFCFENIKFTLGAEVWSTFCSCFCLYLYVLTFFILPSSFPRLFRHHRAFSLCSPWKPPYPHQEPQIEDQAAGIWHN